MTKHLLHLMIGSLVLLCSASIAQPVLTATGINPVIGESFTLYGSTAQVSPGGAGPNATWNLAISGTSTGVSTYEAAASAPSGSSFTGATVAAYNATTSAAQFYKPTTTDLEYCGLVVGAVATVYSSPEIYMQYPFSYTNSFTHNFQAQYTSGYTYTRKGHVTVTSDAYGTLTTPAGTFTDVMRVHMVEAYTDSAHTLNPYEINITNDEYLWYKTGYHLYLAYVGTTTSSQSGTTYGAAYLTGNVGINSTPDLLLSSNLYPNPAINNMTLDLNLKENQKVQIRFVNSLGQQVLNSQTVDCLQGLNSIQFDVADLPEGIYFAEITLKDNAIVNKRFVVTK